MAKKAATNKSEEIILAKTKIASDTVKVQLSKLTLENSRLTKERDDALEENKALRKQNVELASVIENDLKSDLMLNIMAVSDYKKSDLEDLKVEQLQTIAETLSKSKGDTSFYKPIRTGVASQSSSRLTVGNLFGKSPKEIRELGGEF